MEEGGATAAAGMGLAAVFFAEVNMTDIKIGDCFARVDAPRVAWEVTEIGPLGARLCAGNVSIRVPVASLVRENGWLEVNGVTGPIA